jgi:hypothetical protein
VLNLGGSPFVHACCPNSAENTFVGVHAGNFTADATNSTGGIGNNTAVGQYALAELTSGWANTANGYAALFLNTTGWGNTVSGVTAGYNTTGSLNTAEGFDALFSNTTGSSNTAIGASAGQSILSGSSNILVGAYAGGNLSSSESSNILIGSSGVAGDSDTIRIGGVIGATYIAGIRGTTTNNSDAIPVVIDSNGQLGTVSSSRRYKEDIHDMGDASHGLLRLRPVTFHYKKPYADGSKPIQYGLIAEEVAEVYPDLVVRGKDGQVETVQYYKLDAMLLNELQRLAEASAGDRQHIADLTKHQAEQTKTLAADRAEMELLKSQIVEQQKQIRASKRNRDGELPELVQLRAEVKSLAAAVSLNHATVVGASVSGPRTPVFPSRTSLKLGIVTRR